MEPASASAVSAIVAKAMAEIDRLIGEAKKLAKEDSEYYRKWLEVATEAIQGLEREYEGILEQAVSSDIANPRKKQQLLDRIRGYVQGERLRLKLKEAIEHLEEGSKVLRLHAERRLQFPKTRQTREQALTQFEQYVGELRKYLGSLGDYKGPSAVALKDIDDLEKKASRSKNEFHEVAVTLQKNRDKSALFSTTGNAAKTIDVLRSAFR